MIFSNLKIDNSWSLFLDRDGVINRRMVGDYAKSWKDFEFLPGVKEAMALFAPLFGKIIVVSNQQGVGKGLMTLQDVERIHNEMCREIETAGGRIDAVFFAPNLASEKSILRKPAIGMALKARKQFPEIRFKSALMAGDSMSDMIFGKRCGMKTVLINADNTTARHHPRWVDGCYPDLITLARQLPLHAANPHDPSPSK